jgi:hypothetical protein
MKLSAKFFSFLLVLALVAFAATPNYAADPAVRQAGLPAQAHTFDQLLKQTAVAVSTTAGITALDAVSTGTVAVYMLPDTIEYPVKLRIQNHGAESLVYVPYVTGATGVTLPTATSGVLLNGAGAIVKSGLAFEGIFYRQPGFTVSSASGSQNIVVEVWGRKGTE